MTIIIETNRLLLRELEQADLYDLAEILQDPEVMYAYEHDFSLEEVEDWLHRQQDRYRRDGFGLWALAQKETGTVVGQAGLTMQSYKETLVPEIGYLLKKRYWHKGYAREAAEACKQYAFGTLGFAKVYSIIKADNKASKRVAQSIGMKFETEWITQYYNGDMPHEVYAVSQRCSCK